jgi:hypothetical protein
MHRLAPLNSPEPSATLTATEAGAFSAVQLFVERVTAIVEDFALSDANASPVVAICRRLDGLPLAIEFAAPRVEALGVQGLAARLDDSLRLSEPQRRSAMPRHRTMQAVVDWSYGLLSQDEQRFLRALSIFRGGFTVETAAAVALDAATTGADAINRLADLVAKSLVVADASGTKPRLRRNCTSPTALTTRSISCALFTVYISVTPRTVGTAQRCNSHGDSMIWQCVNRTQTVWLWASGWWAPPNTFLATKSAHAAISSTRLRCLSLPITDGASRASRLTRV